MKVVEVEKTIKEITGYRAEDGTFFRTKEECEKYEDTAKAVIRGRFHKLFVGEQFAECVIYEDFGYGSEEFDMAVIEIKSEEDVKTVEMYAEMVGSSFTNFDNKPITTKDIGKRYLVGFNDCCGSDCLYINGTMEEQIEHFRHEMDKFFNPEKYKVEDNIKES